MNSEKTFLSEPHDSPEELDSFLAQLNHQDISGHDLSAQPLLYGLDSFDSVFQSTRIYAENASSSFDPSASSFVEQRLRQLPVAPIVEKPLGVEQTLASQCPRQFHVAPIVQQPLAPQPSLDQPFIDQPCIDQPFTNQPFIDQPFIDQPCIDQPFTDHPFFDQPFIDQPFINQPFIEQPFIDQSFIDQPFTDHPFFDQPFIDQPFINQPFIDQPFIDQSFIDQPFIDQHVSAEQHLVAQPTDRLLVRYSNCFFPKSKSSQDVNPLATFGPPPRLIEKRLPNSAKPVRCIHCWANKTQCEKSKGESRCKRCVRKDLSLLVCRLERFTEHKPFEKWRNETYEMLFTEVKRFSSLPITVCLRHYADGPLLWIQCSQFTVTHKNQVNALRQDQSGWHCTETTAYCLTGAQVDIASYVQQSKHSALQEACRSRNPISFFFKATGPYTNVPIIQQCIELYTALRLLRRAWKFAGNETLGMDTIEQEGSAWSGIRPVPRMIQNQLGHQLELHMMTLDKKILKGIQGMMRDRKQWAVTTIALAILLHTRELDIGRNLYWSRYADPAGFWIHPSKPKFLIEEATISCNSLLSHYRCVWGLTPLSLNWSLQKSKDMVANEERAIKFIQQLQEYVQRLEKGGRIGHEARNMYKDGDPDSVGFTISSLLFKKDNYEAKGVC